jgi:hypothetical protein
VRLGAFLLRELSGGAASYYFAWPLWAESCAVPPGMMMKA